MAIAEVNMVAIVYGLGTSRAAMAWHGIEDLVVLIRTSITNILSMFQLVIPTR